MIQENIIEQINLFCKIFVSNSNLVYIAIISVVSLLMLILSCIFNKSKITKGILIVLYVGVFGYLVINYNKEILSLFDYLVNNIFILLFFPNLAFYILILVLVNIITIRSNFSKNSMFMKIFNIIFFVIFNILFYLIINNIVVNKVNVYEQLSIYTNKNLLVLVELSMKLFVIWVGVLLFNYVVNRLTFMTYKRKNEEITVVSSQDKISKLEYNKIHNKCKNKLDITPVKKKKKRSKVDLTDSVLDNIIDDSGEFEYSDSDYNILIESENNDNNIVLENEDINEPSNIDIESNLLEFKSFNDIIVSDNVYDNTIDTVDYKQVEIPANMTNINDNLKVLNVNSRINSISLNSENNYNNLFEDPMQMILDEINNLKNNYSNKEQVKVVYDKIKDSRNLLSLTDYNNLINQLIEIRK